MFALQILLNGLLLGGLYACVGVGFSLVWGVLNIINVLHGAFVVLGAYLAWLAYTQWGVNPYLFAPVAGLLLFALGWLVQTTVINRVTGAPVLVSMTLTFGLTLLLNNAMLLAFHADFRKVSLDPPMGVLDLGAIVPGLDVFVPVDRLVSMGYAVALVGLLFWVLHAIPIGRAIVAVRMDRYAATLMGVDTPRIFAITFALGAAFAGASGALLSPNFPISPVAGTAYLGASFVVCILGGLGSVPGVLLGGLLLGVLESFGALAFGSEHSLTISFTLLIVPLIVRPSGLLGRRGFQ